MLKTARSWMTVALLTACGTAAQDEGPQSGHAQGELSASEAGSRSACKALREKCMASKRPEPGPCGAYSLRCKVSLGAVGDSVSDEYQGHTNLPASNWLEQLDSRLDLGAYEADPACRGEPRLDGYEYNWSRYGQAILDLQWTDLLPPGVVLPGIPPGNVLLAGLQDFEAQLDGLGAQIAAGKIDIAVIWLGTSDIRIRRVTGAPMSGSDYETFVGQLAGAVGGAVSTLQRHGRVKVVVGLPYDVDPTLADAIATAGWAIRVEAEARGAVVIDAQHEIAVRAEAMTLKVGKFAIDASAASLDALAPDGPGSCMLIEEVEQCATAAYQSHLLNYDGMHFSTVPSGLVAKAIVRAVNQRFGFRLAELSNAEILASAGLAP